MHEFWVSHCWADTGWLAEDTHVALLLLEPRELSGMGLARLLLIVAPTAREGGRRCAKAKCASRGEAGRRLSRST